MNLLIEAIVVGIILVIVASLVGIIVGKFMSVELDEMCKKWNKNHIMEITLFISGVLVHLLCEYLGINKWYCKNGVACKK